MPLGINPLAVAWGFAEATLFFIIPDVLLTWVALDRLRPALLACPWTLAGALLGGIAMYSWGAAHPETANLALVHVPAVNERMLQEVNSQIEQSGVVAVFLGPLSGRPYKIYAVHAGAARVNLLAFLLVSVPARLIRFLLTTLISGLLACTLFRKLNLRRQRILLAAFWIVFYGWFLWNT